MKTVSKMKKKADQVFSHFIRHRDAHKCFTCDKVMPANESQNGHYESRRHNNTRYDEQNCHCQCCGCNIFKKGNMTEYAVRMVRKYGPGILEELRSRAQVIKQFTIKDLEEIIEIYSN